jgi:hypothetical protein
MAAETVPETTDYKAILTRLISLEDSGVFIRRERFKSYRPVSFAVLSDVTPTQLPCSPKNVTGQEPFEFAIQASKDLFHFTVSDSQNYRNVNYKSCVQSAGPN